MGFKTNILSGVVLTSLCIGTSIHWGIKSAMLFGSFYYLNGFHTLHLIRHTLARDLKGARFLLGLLIMVKKSKWQNKSVLKMFDDTVQRTPNKIMIKFQDETWTFRQIDDYSNRIAHYFLENGYTKGDVIALFMENRPQYIAIWLGLAKVGIIPALINTNLKQESLIYSFQVANSKAVIYGTELYQSLVEVLDKLRVNGNKFPCYHSSETNSPKIDFKNLPVSSNDMDKELELRESGPVPSEILNSIGFDDPLLYIYTSGTTGYPKAAVIKHSRYIIAAGGSHTVIRLRDNDVVYCPLPLYHSVAGMLSLAGSMDRGITMVIRKKFSASNYWKDCVKYQVTAAQYIGEICRYLLNSPHCPDEKRHKIRLMFGNGLKPQIWSKFTERFQIKNIAEFYGSTEGNSSIINTENVVGAVGFISVLIPSLMPMALIKIDPETGKELRDPETGHCVRCLPGEPGEFIGKIKRNDPVRDFTGYASDKKATNKKILTDVFTNGDVYFRSGDILESDEFGWLYFKDRTGDTFRWKGENVSTTEVEATIGNLIDLKDTIVYGVEVPGFEGKAGMVAIYDPEELVDLDILSESLVMKLPLYSRPLFLRRIIHQNNLDLTSTFKLKKINYQKAGFDPNNQNGKSGDLLYFLHPKTGKYQRLNVDIYRDIISGHIRI